MKQRLPLILLHLFLCCAVFAGPVDLEQAKGKAAKFMKMLGNDAQLVTDVPAYAPARTIRGVQTDNETPAFYVSNVEKTYCVKFCLCPSDKPDEYHKVLHNDLYLWSFY